MRTGLMCLALALSPATLFAQGITAASIEGTVRDDSGSPIRAATVVVTNNATGWRWEAVTSAAGRYVLEGVAVGGPYHIAVRALGYAPAERSDFLLALGQRLQASFALRATAVELAPIVVSATADRMTDAARTGPAEIVARSTIAELPNSQRDYYSLTLFSPHAQFSRSTGGAMTGGISIAGQNRLFNTFQIDGGVNHDLYQGRLPGRENLPRPISLEAIDQIQVLAAPFDVRYGGFAGGLVNAVTRSGSNDVNGSVFVFLANDELLGRDASGNRPPDFAAWQYGGSIGGPIIRDRAHYFLSADLQRRAAPDPGPLISSTEDDANLRRIGISYGSALRFQEILRDTYRLEPGTVAPVAERAPAEDLFGKITGQLGNNHFELSYHFAHGNRRRHLTRRPSFYELTSATEESPSTSHASRFIWSNLFGGRWSNQLVVSQLRMRDDCHPSASYPRIDVRVDAGGYLVAGPTLTCLGNSLRQGALEVTDNVTLALGAHVVSFGARGELLDFADRAMGIEAGWWSFRSLAALEAGRAYHYQRALPGPLRQEHVAFRVRQLGAYVQDRWSPVPALQISAGLRLDATTLPDAVPTNQALLAALGIDTGQLPRTMVLWSPRLGFNYDVIEGSTVLRGGVGLFSGRTPYRWIANAYLDNGTQILLLTCDDDDVPAFDPLDQPTTCGAGPRPRLSFLDRDFKYPQNLRIALGVDQRLPAGVTATVDLLFNRAVHQVYVSDVNLLPTSAVAAGEANRPLYGTFTSAGIARPARRDGTLGQVIRLSNASGDRALSLSAQLRKRLGADVGELSALYAYTKTQDRMSLVTFGARANLTSTPVDGSLEQRTLSTSYFDTPHRVLLSATLRLPYQTRLSLVYAGASGTPFTYVVDGDANADGNGREATKSDVVYVPRRAAPDGDISLVMWDDELDDWLPVGPAEYARLETFIESEPCLRAQRGRLLARNSCRNPWSGALNGRLSKIIRTLPGQSLELSADLYNVLNFVNSDWGHVRTPTGNAWVPLLSLVGYDAVAQRGVYQLATLPARDHIDDAASRWQLELSMRYSF